MRIRLVRGMALCVALMLTGCAQGYVFTAGLGPQFDQNGAAGANIFVEGAYVAHERPSAPPSDPTELEERDRGPENLLGIALGGGVTAGWFDSGNSAAYVTLDYLPFLYEGVHVNFGGGAGIEWFEGAPRAVGVAPRLGFAVTPWGDDGGRWGIGGRLNMLFTGDGVRAGPAVTVAKVRLGTNAP